VGTGIRAWPASQPLRVRKGADRSPKTLPSAQGACACCHAHRRLQTRRQHLAHQHHHLAHQRLAGTRGAHSRVACVRGLMQRPDGPCGTSLAQRTEEQRTEEHRTERSHASIPAVLTTCRACSAPHDTLPSTRTCAAGMEDRTSTHDRYRSRWRRTRCREGSMP